jgi:hypothetical protein
VIADTPPQSARSPLGWAGALVIAAIYGWIAFTVDFPRAAYDIHSDEATYYLMGHSLAFDGDLEYRREDLARAFREFPNGPNGIFLKRGVDVTGISPTAAPPFVAIHGDLEADAPRLYFGKSFAYPLVAAPFVRFFGTNGFLVLNALLLVVSFGAAYTFLTARSGPLVSLLLASAFIFATVVPVYFVWIAPELFNFTLGLLAYFLWLYKYVASGTPSKGTAWLRGWTTDVWAAALIGLATFSKITNVLLLAPMMVWWAWHRDWRRVITAAAAWGLVTVALFSANVATSGDWNYQGGADRRTCYRRSPEQRAAANQIADFPFEVAGVGLEACGKEHGRSDALLDVIFDPEMFWINLRANLGYYFVGRYSGLVAYFFPAVFAMTALLLARRSRQPWQWLVLLGVVGQILLFILTQPYTWAGSGGSVGNRYFMGIYGMCLFLLPVIRRVGVALVPWLVGSVFVAPLVLNPFFTSFRPAEHAKSGPLRWLPVELTSVNDLPINTDRSRVAVWFGDNPGLGDPGFQIYYLDDNGYTREADRSFWVRGRSRAEVLIKTDRPFSYLTLTLSAGRVSTTTTVELNGQETTVELVPGQSKDVIMRLGEGFKYKLDREIPARVWLLSIRTSDGFVPAEVEKNSTDTRFLGVRVKPVIR